MQYNEVCIKLRKKESLFIFIGIIIKLYIENGLSMTSPAFHKEINL